VKSRGVPSVIVFALQARKVVFLLPDGVRVSLAPADLSLGAAAVSRDGICDLLQAQLRYRPFVRMRQCPTRVLPVFW
jgi:hypothetical protein